MSKSKALSRFRLIRGKVMGAYPTLRLRWYESWIVKAAALTSFVLFCGYVSSLFIAVQGIESVSRIAYDEDIEEGLGNHLKMIKEVHGLRKESVVSRLKTIIPPQVRLEIDADISKKQIRAWLKKAKIENFAKLEDAEISKINAADLAKYEQEGTAAIEWLDQESLKIYNHIAHFPKSMAFIDYQTAQSLRQRYQLIGVSLEKDILPTLVRANSLIIAITFILLVSAFWLLARRFKKAVEKVISGFSYWSEANSKFRFDNQWRGELRLITAQFNAMADEVESNKERSLYLEKVASWQTMARKLAHEIKNPLTPIQMMVSQLKRHYDGNDEKFTHLLDQAQTIISEEVGGLRRMVENFSQFAKLPEPKLAEQDLGTILENVVTLQSAAFANHHITLERESESELLIQVDADLLRQVLINLIKNAAEANQHRNAKIWVEVSTSDKWVMINICDDGPGIPEEMANNIFEAYFTTKHTGPNPGMGLGLAICQKVVVDHKGKINVESKPGLTKFKIRLPFKESTDAERKSS